MRPRAAAVARRGLASRRLYFIADAGARMTELLEQAIVGGADIVQVREKQLADSALLARLEAARELTRRHDVPLVVNDRADLAALVEADYVHVGQEDLPVDVARKLIAGVGQSTHTSAEVDRSTADYVGVGPVHATPTKQGRAPVGLSLVEHAARFCSVPWFAIGGIDLDTIAAVTEAGATRVAVVRAIGEAPDAEAATRALRARLPD